MKNFKAKSISTGQRELFGIEQVAELYKRYPEMPIDNASLYEMASKQVGVAPEYLGERVPVGKSGQKHNLAHRAIRWSQQSLKRLGILERVKGERGIWRLTEDAKRGLSAAKPGVKVLGFSTNLGIAVFGSSNDIFKRLDSPVMLVIGSPPYPLAHERKYGNPCQKEIVKFLMGILEPIIEKLDERGSLSLNLSNDIFIQGTPARSTYVERLVIALEDSGLYKMDSLIWENRSKAPGPMQWSSKTRQQLNVSWEPILWFAKNPILVKSDNRRVLEPHTDRHLKLIASGGEARHTNNSDGAYRLRPGSFSNETTGRIPKNVISRGHRCAYGLKYQRACAKLGLTPHGAGQPLSIPDFLIRFLTEENDLVIDPWGGRSMTGLAADLLNRRWMTGELQLDYVRGAAELFRERPGFHLNPQIERAFTR